MARLRKEEATGCAVSDDSDFAPLEAARKAVNTTEQVQSISSRQRQVRISPRKKTQQSYCLDDTSDAERGHEAGALQLVPKTTPKRAQPGRQIVLKPLNPSPFSRPLHRPLLQPLELRAAKKREAIPRRLDLPKPQPAEDEPPARKDVSDDSTDEVEVEESIWCGSNHESEESEEELPSVRKFIVPRRLLGAPPKLNPMAPPAGPLLPARKEFASSLNDSDDSQRFLPYLSKTSGGSITLSRPGSSSDKENAAAILRFSPPRLYSPSKVDLNNRPVTPPQSPSKSRLQSPSKTRTRIPTPPLRQSLDAFWNADTVNDWNEQYSPKKLLKSPRKLKLTQDDNSQSPPSSPRKPQSPSKRTQSERDAKKSFERSKHRVAEDFLAELDSRLTSNQITALASSTGGVRLIWSKTLNSTAGRANWRKETTKSRLLDGTTTTTAKHHASIELAEKVIDCEHRLLNVLAHEFCHLANFMISGVKDQPHGRQFKLWGQKCTRAFGERGVEVTTKHSYAIEYKYVWQCENEMCGAEFQRHSKSIDPARKVCGSCKGRLVQVKPVPRKEGVGKGGYAAYVKENFAEVKRGLGVGVTQKEVMEAVARKYRAEKDAKGAVEVGGRVEGTQDVMAKLTSAVEVITLDDD